MTHLKLQKLQKGYNRWDDVPLTSTWPALDVGLEEG